MSTYTVLYRDEVLLVVDKAAGVLSVPAPGKRERCLLDDLRRDGHKVAPVHRLDKETSGVLLLSLSPAHRDALEKVFLEHRVEKTYLALVQGVPHPARATIDVPIRDLGASARVERAGQRAITHYEVVQRLQGAALVRCRPETGRHNQIRVHMAHVGHPLLGDRKFGSRSKGEAPRRALLHAGSLRFPHPVGGKLLTVEAPLPADMREWIARLGS